MLSLLLCFLSSLTQLVGKSALMSWLLLGADAEAVVCISSRDSVQCQQTVMGQLGKSCKLLQTMEEHQISTVLDLKSQIGKMEKQLACLAGAPA